MSERRARIIALNWLIHIHERELVEALTAEALRTLHIPNRDTPPKTMLSEEQEHSAPRV